MDDTFWDQTDPAQSIGTLLVDEDEAQAVAAVVALIVGVSERLGPAATDAAWCSDAAWPQVQEAARRAAAVLRSNSG